MIVQEKVTVRGTVIGLETAITTDLGTVIDLEIVIVQVTVTDLESEEKEISLQVVILVLLDKVQLILTGRVPLIRSEKVMENRSQVAS